MQKIPSKAILITGASSGFGRATAIKFSKLNYKLILGARNLNALEKLKDEIYANHASSSLAIYSSVLDVTSQISIDHFFNDLPNEFEEIDILVNNAGLALGIEPAQEADSIDWEIMVDTNIKGLMRVTKSVLPKMVQRNTGHIFNIGSIAGSWPYPGGNTYGGTKAFVAQFSRGLRADLLGTNVRVTNIEPGMSETNFSNIRFKGDTEKAANVYKNTQSLTGEDIAEIIAWISQTPAHVNINALEVMPTCQAWGPLSVNRDTH